MVPSRRDVAKALALGLAIPSIAGCANSQAVDANLPESTVLAEAMSDQAVPGMAALVIRDFRGEPELAAGRRALGGIHRIAPGDRWHLGSNGKAMTATLIARLVEAGVLAWDRPLALMLPDLAQNVRPEYLDVTLPDLLSHRAGLPENTSDLDFLNTFYDDPALPTAQRIRYIGACLREEPIGAARAASSYSNTGLLIAAAAAEYATKRPFEALIVSEIFVPLEMTSVGFEQFGGADEPQGHVDGRIASMSKDANPRMFAPAGGMRMTMRDWSRFCIDQMQGEHGRGALLRAETYRFLHTGQADTGSALGWGAAPRPMNLTGPAITHAGSDGNWYALVCLFPQTGNGVLVAANAAGSMGGDKAASIAMRALARTVALELTT